MPTEKFISTTRVSKNHIWPNKASKNLVLSGASRDVEMHRKLHKEIHVTKDTKLLMHHQSQNISKEIEVMQTLDCITKFNKKLLSKRKIQLELKQITELFLRYYPDLRKIAPGFFPSKFFENCCSNCELINKSWSKTEVYLLDQPLKDCNE